MHKSIARPSNSRSERLNISMKELAHIEVAAARRDGTLLNPGKCSDCGSDRSVDGHHDDYSRPLDVRWLCSKCHQAWHKENGPGENADTILKRLTCVECGENLPLSSRRDMKYCSIRCRRTAFDDRSHEGRVASVRRLKSGKMSIVIHMPDRGLRPGDSVRVGKDTD